MLNSKIAFVIDGLQMGGAEKFLVDNANNFSRNGYQPIVILLSEEKALLNELEKNIKVVTLLRTSRYDLMVTRRIKKIIKAEQIRKIFCINAYSFFLTKLAFLFDRRTNFYLSLHTTIPLSKKNYFKNFIYFRFLSKRDVVIYICNNQRIYLRKKYHISPKTEKVVYNGIDTSYFDPALFKDLNFAQLRRGYNLEEKDHVIINVARLYPEKGHFYAFDALALLHNKYNKKAHLLLVGGGTPDYTRSLKDYVKERELQQYVHFMDNQYDVRKFYFLSDIFTLTSDSIETFSLAALEAMAFGLPCSLTDIGGANEMIIEGFNGVLSKSKNPLSIAESWEKLLNVNLKGDSIRNFVIEKFSLGQMLKSYIKITEQ